jgi:hypothetical protein
MKALLSLAVLFGGFAIAYGAPPAGSGEDGKTAEGEKKYLLRKSDQLVETDPFDVSPTRNRRKVYELKATANRKYILEGTSTSFALALRVEDSAGRPVQVEFLPLANGRRISFTPPKADVYRIIAASSYPTAMGSFTLRVLEPDDHRFEKSGTLTADDPLDRVVLGRHCKRYPYKMEKGQTYAIAMSSSLFDTQLRVEAPNGAEVASRSAGTARDTWVSFTPPQSETYTIVATSAGAGSLGPFTLTVFQTGTPAGVEPLERKDTLEASDPLDRVATGSYRKVYEQKLDAGRAYVMEMSSSAFQPYLRVEDLEERSLVQCGDAATSRVVFVPPASRSYRIVASSRQPDRLGPFTLKVSATDPREDLAQKITGRLSLEDPLHRTPTKRYAKQYDWKMTGGKRYVVDVRGASFAPLVSIEDEKGRVVARGDEPADSFTSSLSFIPPDSDTYKVIVTSVADERTGAFQLRMFTEDAQAKPALEQRDRLSDADALDSATTHRHYQPFPVQLTIGQVYDITLVSPDLEGYVYLQDGRGRVIAEDAADEDGRTVRLRFSPPRTEKYTIIATTASPRKTGRFSLRVAPIPTKEPAPPLLTKESALTADDPFFQLPTQNYRKSYDLKMEAGQTYLVRMRSKDFDPYLRLEDTERNSLVATAANPSQPADLLFACPRTGSYRIITTSTRKQQTGSFDLTVDRLAALDPKADQLETTDPRLTLPTPWRRKELTHTFEAGKSYLVQIDKPQSSTLLIQDAAESASPPLASRGSAQMPFTPARSGKYRIIAFGERPGPFEVLIRPLATERVKEDGLERSDPRDWQMVQRRRKVYPHPLAANQPYTLVARSDAFAPLVRVLDAAGNVVASGGDGSHQPEASTVFTPPVTGTYSIVVTSRGGERTGPFLVRLQPLVSRTREAGRLTGEDAFDSLPSGKTCKRYEYKMQSGQFFTLQLTSKAFPALLRVADPQGKEVARAGAVGSGKPGEWFPIKVAIAPSRPGTYQVIVTSVDPGQFGPFQLGVQSFQTTLTKADGLSFSDPFDRVPTFQFCKTYRQELKQGGPYILEMTSKAFGPSLRLEDSQGSDWVQASAASGGVARLVVFPAAADNARIIASSIVARQTGPFTLTVASPRLVVSEAGKLTSDDYFDPLQNQSYQKVHLLKLKAGEFCLISLEAREFTPNLRVESSRGQHLKPLPDIRRPGEGHITFVAPRDDTYRIIVTSSNSGGTGAYRLLVRQ